MRTIVGVYESKEKRGFFVRPTDEDGDLVDPTSWPVELALGRIYERPATLAFGSATWSSGGPVRVPELGGDAWQAELTVGPTGSSADLEVVAKGDWYAYARVTATDETPVMLAGVLRLI